MANLKDLKTRINSVKSTHKITAAMKMVAAAKLRRAQDAAESGRPYSTRMRQVIGNHTTHPVGIRPASFGCFLRAAQFRRCHHFHGSGDFLRGLDAVNTRLQILQ